MISFTPLASSSAACAYLLQAEGHHPLLLDAGLNFKELQRRLWGYGVNVSDLAGVLISHAHGDHSRAVPKLMEAGVDCYALWPAWGEMRCDGHRRNEMQDGTVIGTLGWQWQAFEVDHDSPGTSGFVILDMKSDETLLYVTDAAYLRHRYDGLSIIAIECNHDAAIMRENVLAGRQDVARYQRTRTNHMSIDTVLEMLKANDLTRCREIHLLHLSDSNSDAEAFKTAVMKATGVPTFVAEA